MRTKVYASRFIEMQMHACSLYRNSCSIENALNYLTMQLFDITFPRAIAKKKKMCLGKLLQTQNCMVIHICKWFVDFFLFAEFGAISSFFKHTYASNIMIIFLNMLKNVKGRINISLYLTK